MGYILFDYTKYIGKVEYQLPAIRYDYTDFMKENPNVINVQLITPYEQYPFIRILEALNKIYVDKINDQQILYMENKKRRDDNE